MRTLGCAHYLNTREGVRTIPMHAGMCALSDTRENVRTIRMHARMCALFDPHEDVRTAVFGKNRFLERCIDKMKISSIHYYLPYHTLSISIHI